MNKAVFIDRDGTIIKDQKLKFNINLIEINTGLIGVLRIIQAKGFLLFIVSNQSVVARGINSLNEVQNFNTLLEVRLIELGIFIKEFVICPHHPYAKLLEFRINCNCRKPNNGMIEYLINKYDVNCNHSFLIGDKDTDIEAGNKSNLLRTYKIDKFTNYSELKEDILRLILY